MSRIASEAIERNTRRVEDIKNSISLIETIGDLPIGRYFISHEGELTITIHNMAELHIVRQHIKSKIATYEDKLGSIFYCHGDMVASYRSTRLKIVIYLETLPEEFPQELQSEYCKVVKTDSVVIDQYAYVCEVKDEG